MKKLREKYESKLLDKEEVILSSPKNRGTRKFREGGAFSDLSRFVEPVKEDGDSEPSSPHRVSQNVSGSFTQLKQTNSNSINEGSKMLPRKTKTYGSNNFSLLDEGSEDEEIFGEGAKQMVKRLLSTQSSTNSSNVNDVIYEILKGDLKRNKLMTEKQLEDLIEHQKENLSIKKDYLESLAKYVTSLEDTLQKTQRKQRNMYLFLLEHPKDIT